MDWKYFKKLKIDWKLFVKVIFVGISILSFLFLPHFLVVGDLKEGILDLSKVWAAEQEYRKLILQIIGGGVVIFGAVMAYRRMKATESQLEKTDQQIELIRVGQINDRFTRAVELLSNQHIDVRVGALITLEEICHESESLSWTIFQIINAFISRRAGKNIIENEFKNRTEIDVSQGLDILIKLSSKRKGWIIVLRDIDLKGYSIPYYKSGLVTFRIYNSNLYNFYYDSDSKMNISIVKSRVSNSTFVSEDEDTLLKFKKTIIDEGSVIDMLRGNLRVLSSKIMDSTLNLTGDERIQKVLFNNVKFVGKVDRIDFFSSYFYNCKPTPASNLLTNKESYLEKEKKWNDYLDN